MVSNRILTPGTQEFVQGARDTSGLDILNAVIEQRSTVLELLATTQAIRDVSLFITQLQVYITLLDDYSLIEPDTTMVLRFELKELAIAYASASPINSQIKQYIDEVICQY